MRGLILYPSFKRKHNNYTNSTIANISDVVDGPELCKQAEEYSHVPGDEQVIVYPPRTESVSDTLTRDATLRSRFSGASLAADSVFGSKNELEHAEGSFYPNSSIYIIHD